LLKHSFLGRSFVTVLCNFVTLIFLVFYIIKITWVFDYGCRLWTFLTNYSHFVTFDWGHYLKWACANLYFGNALNFGPYPTHKKLVIFFNVCRGCLTFSNFFSMTNDGTLHVNYSYPPPLLKHNHNNLKFYQIFRLNKDFKGDNLGIWVPHSIHVSCVMHHYHNGSILVPTQKTILGQH